MKRYESYIICTSPRSGSTLLCDLLSATGVSGKPASLFHQPSIAAWLEYYGLTDNMFTSNEDRLQAIFRAAHHKGSGDTGMFGLHLQRASFEFFIQQLKVLHPHSAGDAERIRATFGRTLFIHLTRCNKLDQAISYVKAQQSGLWHKAPDGTELERLSPPSPPEFDFDAIAGELARMTAFDDQWHAWFEVEAIYPLRLHYEALSQDPIAILRNVLGALRVDANAAKGIAPGVAKLADGVNAQWAEMYRARANGAY